MKTWGKYQIKNNRKKILAILNIVALLTVCIFIGADLYTRSVTIEITFDIVDATQVPNGIHVGKYSLSPVFVCVEVTVDNEQITQITILEHQSGLGGKAEAIVDNILEQQSIEVESISGATASSVAIQKAIENALLRGRL